MEDPMPGTSEYDALIRATVKLTEQATITRDEMRAARLAINSGNPDAGMRLAIANRAWSDLAKYGYFGVEHTEFEK